MAPFTIQQIDGRAYSIKTIYMACHWFIWKQIWAVVSKAVPLSGRDSSSCAKLSDPPCIINMTQAFWTDCNSFFFAFCVSVKVDKSKNEGYMQISTSLKIFGDYLRLLQFWGILSSSERRTQGCGVSGAGGQLVWQLWQLDSLPGGQHSWEDKSPATASLGWDILKHGVNILLQNWMSVGEILEFKEKSSFKIHIKIWQLKFLAEPIWTINAYFSS